MLTNATTDITVMKIEVFDRRYHLIKKPQITSAF